MANKPTGPAPITAISVVIIKKKFDAKLRNKVLSILLFRNILDNFAIRLYSVFYILLFNKKQKLRVFDGLKQIIIGLWI